MRFEGDGGAGEADPADPRQQNDDDISLEISLGFTFYLYGTPQTSVFIDNNGNVSFGAGYATYTPEGFPIADFPIADFPMVAPFWGDVDTSGLVDRAGVVWMKQGANYLAVTWDHVGYYDEQTDKLNTFQLLISDGTFEEMGLGNNVCFCYGDMQWTTGDASGGSGGFGGSPATVGVSKGNGIDYFLLGRFDHPGTDYDGPGGVPDGVDWLDGQQFCFNVGAESNQPPVPVDFPPGDRTDVVVGETLVDDGGLANFSWLSTDGNPSLINMMFVPDMFQVGEHVIRLTAIDDFDPEGVTENDLTIEVIDPVDPD